MLAAQAVHVGVVCDGRPSCWGRAPVQGTRFKCLGCYQTDFCSACAPLHASTGHILLPFDRPVHDSWHVALDSALQPLCALTTAHAVGAPLPGAAAAAAQSRVEVGFGEGGVAAARGEAADLVERKYKGLEALHASLLPPRGGGAQLLSDVFFRLLGVEALPDRSLQAYAPRHDALLLSSDVDGAPLVAVQVLPAAVARGGAHAEGAFSALWCVSGGGGGGAAAGARPGTAGARYQALFSRPDVHFAVVLTNLTADRLGLVLRPSTADGELTGTGLPTNAVNIVAAGESLIVDANAEGLALILKEALEAVRDAATGRVEQRPVAFRDERDRAAAAKVGSYSCVDVFCLGGTAGAAAHAAPLPRYERTSWGLADVFVRERPPPPPTVARPVAPPVAHARGGAGLRQQGEFVTDFALAAEVGAPLGNGGWGGIGGAASPRLFAAAVAKRALGAENMADLDPPGRGVGQRRSLAGAPPRAASSAGAPPRAASSALLDTANVGVIALGGAVEGHVRGHETNDVFGFSMTPVVLGLAVQRVLQKAPAQCYEHLHNAATAALVAARARAPVPPPLPPGLNVFAEDHCVICLEDDPPPNTVFLPCGHMCVHWDESSEMRVCVLCNRGISARLCVRGGAIVERVEDLPRPRPIAPGRPGRPMPIMARKPVVYLYPTEPIVATVHVKLLRGATFSCLVPSPRLYGGAATPTTAWWRVLAHPDGLLEQAAAPGDAAVLRTPADAAAPPMPPIASLFWEAEDFTVACSRAPPPACLRGADAGDWLLRALARVGLSPREATECAVFWALRCAAHPWVLVTFLPQHELDAVAPLTVTPRPDTTLRVFLVIEGAREPRAGATDALPPAVEVARKGVYVCVEWGGCEVSGRL